MKEETISTIELNRLKQCEILILTEVDRICRKYNISYTLGYGTMLGAVRHHGFIPWDDDVDICMMRDDFNRFREICETELGDLFFYQSHETDKNYYHLHDKIRLNGTVFKETFLADSDIHHGVYIDVFPVDYLYDKKLWNKLQYCIVKTCRALLYAKFLNVKARHGKKKIAAGIIKCTTFFISKNCLYNIAISWASRCKKATRVCSFTSLYKRKDIFDKIIFENTMNISFENRTFLILTQYDSVLRQLYGDYMKMPPEEERNTRHELVEFSLPDNILFSEEG